MVLLSYSVPQQSITTTLNNHVGLLAFHEAFLEALWLRTMHGAISHMASFNLYEEPTTIFNDSGLRYFQKPWQTSGVSRGVSQGVSRSVWLRTMQGAISQMTSFNLVEKPTTILQDETACIELVSSRFIKAGKGKHINSLHLWLHSRPH